jgi:peroxiredoxin
VEASVPAVNRVLAAQHQAEKFLHSFSGRIDDIPLAGKIGDAAKAPVQLVQEPTQMEETHRATGLPLAPIQPSPTGKGRAAVAQVRASGITYSIETPQHQIYRAYGGVLDLQEHTGVRGFVEVQVSTPTITLPVDSTSRVTIHYNVMVHFVADAGTPALPEFLHGEVQATVDVDQVAWQSGNVLEIDFTADDIDVTFNPVWTDPPLTQSQGALINKVIRNVLRTKFGPTTQVLPQGIQQLHFKMMPDNVRPAVTMMLDVRGDAPQNPDPNLVTQIFLQNDWGIAAGRDYILSVLSEAINAAADSAGLRDLDNTFDVTIIDGWHVHPTYHIHSDFSVDLQPGQIVVTITGSAHSPDWYAPDFNFTVTQALGIQIIAGTPVLSAIGDPNISVSNWFVGLFKGYFAGKLNDARAQLLAQAQPAVQKVLDSNLSLGALLQDLNISAQLSYTSIEIRTDGLILHGTLNIPSWNPVHIDSSGENVVVPGGGSGIQLNALNSWIPGGTITEFVWTVSGNPPMVIHEQHRFVARAPGVFTQGSTQWCLKVNGNRITDSGAPALEAVSGKTPNCKIMFMQGGSLAGHNPFANRLTASLAQPVPAPGPGSVSCPALADIDPFCASVGAANDGTNLVVFFGDAEFNAQLALVHGALQASRKKESAVMFVTVLPQGELAKVRPITVDANISLVVTEDHEGNWRKTFEVRELPAMFIVNPEGEKVWHHQGRIEIGPLTTAFNEHLRPGGRLRHRQLRIAATRGETAPDFLFEYARQHGRERSRERYMALHDLRGRRVLLVFWAAWSQPAIAQLRYLQRIQHEASRENPVILAISDGDERNRAAEVFEKNRFTHQLIIDQERQISRRYAINCWPTTIAIDDVGRVSWIHFGLTPAEEQFQEG